MADYYRVECGNILMFFWIDTSKSKPIRERERKTYVIDIESHSKVEYIDRKNIVDR